MARSKRLSSFPLYRYNITCLLVNWPSLAIDVAWSITPCSTHALRWCNLSLITPVINRSGWNLTRYNFHWNAFHDGQEFLIYSILKYSPMSLYIIPLCEISFHDCACVRGFQIKLYRWHSVEYSRIFTAILTYR